MTTPQHQDRGGSGEMRRVPPLVDHRQRDARRSTKVRATNRYRLSSRTNCDVAGGCGSGRYLLKRERAGIAPVFAGVAAKLILKRPRR